MVYKIDINNVNLKGRNLKNWLQQDNKIENAIGISLVQGETIVIMEKTIVFPKDKLCTTHIEVN